jgi:hypothetical protein
VKIMKKDFRVGQSNEIVQGGRVFDLHNQYDFSGVYVGPNRSVQVSFAPHPEHGRGHPPVVLMFDGVDYFELSSSFGTQPIPGLDELGYKNPDDRDDASLLSEEQAADTDHLFLRFDSGFVRIRSESARLQAGPVAVSRVEQ